MQYQKVIVNYPSTQRFIDFLEEQSYRTEYLLYDALISFFNCSSSSVDLTLDQKDMNILVINTESKQISSQVNKLLEAMREKNIRVNNVRVFITECPQNIKLIGTLPHITKLIRMNIPFDVIFCQSLMVDREDIYHLRELISDTGLLITDYPIKGRYSFNFEKSNLYYAWEECNIVDGFNCYMPKDCDRRSVVYNIREFDLTIDQFIEGAYTGNEGRIPLEDYLITLTNNLIMRSIVDIVLNRNIFNLLVMCSTDDTIRGQYYKRIARNVIDEHIDISDADVYHIGVNIGIEDKPLIHRGTLEKMNVRGQFDLIISENCPITAMMGSMLKVNGVLICPVYSSALRMDGFEILDTKSDKFKMFYKIK